jgi:hypothetical protein
LQLAHDRPSRKSLLSQLRETWRAIPRPLQLPFVAIVIAAAEGAACALNEGLTEEIRDDTATGLDFRQWLRRRRISFAERIALGEIRAALT